MSAVAPGGGLVYQVPWPADQHENQDQSAETCLPHNGFLSLFDGLIFHSWCQNQHQNHWHRNQPVQPFGGSTVFQYSTHETFSFLPAAKDKVPSRFCNHLRRGLIA